MVDNNQNEQKSKQVLLSVLAIAILVVAVVGVSFAAFTYTQKGNKENKVTTGTIKMDYTEDTNEIQITDAVPIDDATGKAIMPDAVGTAGTASEGHGTFDFIVSATIAGTATINYEIGAEKVAVTKVEPSADNQNVGTMQLPDNAVKLYLTKDAAEGDDYAEDVLTPTIYDEIPAGTGGDGKVPATAKKIGDGTFNATGTTNHKYRLRMWVADSFPMESLIEGTPGTPEAKQYKGQFKVKINVYGAI